MPWYRTPGPRAHHHHHQQQTGLLAFFSSPSLYQTVQVQTDLGQDCTVIRFFVYFPLIFVLNVCRLFILLHKMPGVREVALRNLYRNSCSQTNIRFDFLSYIFNVSENTKIIHLIQMIWLFGFIISSFKLASGPPNDPGGSKEDIFKIKEMIHRIFSVKANIEPVPK